MLTPGRNVDNVDTNCGYEFTVEGIKPLDDAIAVFWRAAETHQWSVACRIGAVCCVAITRQLRKRQALDRHCDRDKTYVEEAKAKRFHPGALAVLQSLACFNLASSRGSRWSVPDSLLRGLHQFCSVPRDVIATDFALTQICPTGCSEQSAAITLAAKTPPRGADCESGKARAAWLIPLQRARALQEFHEVTNALLPLLRCRGEQKVAIFSDASSSHFIVRICADTASWKLLVDSSNCGFENARSSSTHNAALLWENARASAKDMGGAVNGAEVPLVALQLDMLAGLNLQKVWSMCSSSGSADSLKLRCLCLAFTLNACEGQKNTEDAGELEQLARSRKRKRDIRDTAHKMSDRQRLLCDVSQMDGACCAAIGLDTVRSGISTDQMTRLLWHLDNSMMSPCLGGEPCVQYVLTAVTRGLLEHSITACSALRAMYAVGRACKTAADRSMVSGYQSGDKMATSSLLGWMEVVKLIQQRRWWLHDFRGTEGAGRSEATLLQQAKHLSERLGCKSTSVLHNILSILLVLHGPQTMLASDNILKLLRVEVDVPRSEETLAHGMINPIDALQGLYRNTVTLWRHRMIP